MIINKVFQYNKIYTEKFDLIKRQQIKYLIQTAIYLKNRLVKVILNEVFR